MHGSMAWWTASETSRSRPSLPRTYSRSWRALSQTGADPESARLRSSAERSAQSPSTHNRAYRRSCFGPTRTAGSRSGWGSASRGGPARAAAPPPLPPFPRSRDAGRAPGRSTATPARSPAPAVGCRAHRSPEECQAPPAPLPVPMSKDALGSRRHIRSAREGATTGHRSSRDGAAPCGQRQPRERRRLCAPRGQARSSGTAPGAPARRTPRDAVRGEHASGRRRSAAWSCLARILR